MKVSFNKATNAGICLLFVVGFCILLYPTFSNYYNKIHSSKAVGTYITEIENTSTIDYDKLINDARIYNNSLGKNTESTVTYQDCLNIQNGMMGYLQIDEIDLSLPIYHGTTESVLQKGVGHLEWTSLPTGDIGEHTVLTGHTGLPSAKLFTDLDKLVIGDRFKVIILDEVFYYRIVEVNIVEPHEVNLLAQDPDLNLVTLVTCTPYGVNSHRLLIQGERLTMIDSTFNPITISNPFNIILIFIIIAVILMSCKMYLIYKKNYEIDRKNQRVLLKIYAEIEADLYDCSE